MTDPDLADGRVGLIPFVAEGIQGGFRLSESGRLVNWLEVLGQASLLRADNTTDNGPLAFVPPNRVRGALTFRREELFGFRNLYAEVSSTLVDRQRRFDINTDFAPPPDGYFLLGAEIGAERKAFGQRMKIALTGRNLTNQRYREYTSLLRYFADRPGLQAMLRLSLLFDARDF